MMLVLSAGAQQLGSELYRGSTLPYIRLAHGLMKKSDDGWRTTVMVHIYNVPRWDRYYVCIKTGDRRSCFDEETGVKPRVVFRNPTFRYHSLLELTVSGDDDLQIEADLVMALEPPVWPLGQLLDQTWRGDVHILSSDTMALSGTPRAPVVQIQEPNHPLVKHVEQCLEDAAMKRSLPDWIHALDGLVSASTRELFHNLIRNWPSERKVTYVEIGVYRGASLCAASYGKDGVFIGIDDWSFQGNRDAALTAIEKCGTVSLIDGDAFALDITELPTIDIFFYDGGHEALDQFRGLLDFEPRFADTVLLIVDDFHEVAVQDATDAAVDVLTTALHWRLLFQSSFFSSDEIREANAIFLLEKRTS